MTSRSEGLSSDIVVNLSKLEVVESFKYLGATITDEGSKKEVVCRIAQATAAMTKLSTIWKDRDITLKTQIRLMRYLVTSIFLYACESWTLKKDTEKRIQAFKMRCYRRLLGINFRDHITNEEVLARIKTAAGPPKELLKIVKERKLRWFGHVTRREGMAKTILQGPAPGKRGRGRPRRSWMDDINEWSGLGGRGMQSHAHNREEWRKLVCVASSVPQRPPRLRDR